MERTLIPALPLSKKESRELKAKYVKLLNASDAIDKAMVGESISNYILQEIDYTNKICLDLGANIGSFTKIALDKGAKKVYAVECDIRNFQKLQDSFGDDSSVDLIHAAVSGLTDETIKIYKSPSSSAHCSTSIINRRRFNNYDTVKNINIKELLKKYNPDIIKVDIEGAEYSILEDLIEYFPNSLFLELHAHEHLEKYQSILSEMYGISKIEERVAWQHVVAKDCFFKK